MMFWLRNKEQYHLRTNNYSSNYDTPWLSSLFTFKKSNNNIVITTRTSNNNNIITSSSSIILMIVTTTIATFTILPFTLATITLIRQQRERVRRLKTNEKVEDEVDNNDISTLPSSSLYYGKVWHTRYYPKKHHFQYPIFIFGLNLNEVIKKRIFSNYLWPLSPYIIQFNPLRDHLKQYDNVNEKKMNTVEEQTIILCNRIYELISNRTSNKFTPNHTTHVIYLITHLSYYNYCFNPVSFYYIIRRPSSTISKNNMNDNELNDDINKNSNHIIIDAVVGEVSNTPWNEMYCYVLHPDAKEIDEVQQIITNTTNQQPTNEEEEKQVEEVQYQHKIQVKNDDEQQQEDDQVKMQETNNQNNQNLLHYIFPKRFHVSPFMEMSYYYEWKFYNLFHNNNQKQKQKSTIHIINNLLRLDDKNIMQFHAQMIVHETSIHPYRIVYHMITYPIYCMTIQIWIHYEAMILFIIKGVSYQPHPNESETAASRIIGTIMTPFFYNWKDLMSQYFSQKKES